MLISSMGDTVIGWVNKGTVWLARRTILPERVEMVSPEETSIDMKPGTKLREQTGEVEDIQPGLKSPGEHAPEKAARNINSEKQRMHKALNLVKAISKLATDLHSNTPVIYNWNEWEKFMILVDEDDEEVGRDWKWLADAELFGHGFTETEWILQKMCVRLKFLLEGNQTLDENN